MSHVEDKEYEYNQQKVSFRFWDLYYYRCSMNYLNRFYEGAKGAIIVFDLKDLNWLGSIESQVSNIRYYLAMLNEKEDIPIIVMANKLDSKSDNDHPACATDEQIDEFCKKHSNILFYEKCSVKNGTGVNEPIEKLFRKILENRNEEPIMIKEINHDEMKVKKKRSLFLNPIGWFTLIIVVLIYLFINK